VDRNTGMTCCHEFILCCNILLWKDELKNKLPKKSQFQQRKRFNMLTQTLISLQEISTEEESKENSIHQRPNRDVRKSFEICIWSLVLKKARLPRMFEQFLSGYFHFALVNDQSYLH
jgi:hypothetical protein